MELLVKLRGVWFCFAPNDYLFGSWKGMNK